MTVKELYEFCKTRGLENYEISAGYAIKLSKGFIATPYPEITPKDIAIRDVDRRKIVDITSDDMFDLMLADAIKDVDDVKSIVWVKSCTPESLYKALFAAREYVDKTESQK